MATKQATLKALVAAAKQHEKSSPTRMIHLENRDFQTLVALAAKAPIEEDDAVPVTKEKGPPANVSALAREIGDGDDGET